MVILFDKRRKREPYPPYSSVRHGGKGDSDTAKAKAFPPGGKPAPAPARSYSSQFRSAGNRDRAPARKTGADPAGGVPLPVLPPYKAGGKIETRPALGPQAPSGPVRHLRVDARVAVAVLLGADIRDIPVPRRGEEPAHMGGAVGVGIALIRPIAEIGGLFQPGVQKEPGSRTGAGRGRLLPPSPGFPS